MRGRGAAAGGRERCSCWEAGGCAGFAHIGVIRALERLGIEIDEVVGTSMGAVMGGLFASGRDSHAMEEVASEISLKDYFKLNLVKFLVRGYRHASVYKGKAFQQFLERALPQRHFAELSRPFFCNALSLTNGSSRFFGLPGADHVPVADAVYASACLPAVFEPPMIDDDYYIDGGMTETIALRLALARAPDLILAVDLSHREVREIRDYRASLPHILFATYEIMGQALNEANLHGFHDERTVLLKPNLSHVGCSINPMSLRWCARRARGARGAHDQPDDPVSLRSRVGLRGRSIRARAARLRGARRGHECLHQLRHLRGHLQHSGLRRHPVGDVVRKLHNYECTRDMACERNCPRAPSSCATSDFAGRQASGTI